MKKVMFGLACAATMIACADIESSNVVGYSTRTARAGLMDIFGTGFRTVGGGLASIQDVKLSDSEAEGTDGMNIWDPELREYRYVYWYASGTYSDDYETEYPAGWGDDGQVRIDETLNPGQGFWLEVGSDVKVTMSGEVPAASDNKAVAKGGQMDFFTAAFPVACSIQNIKLVDSTAEGTDGINIWDAENREYVYAYWFASGVYDEEYETNFGPGWGDDGQVRVDIQLEAGQGFCLEVQEDTAVETVLPAAK